jgi:competence protein ComGC
MKTSYRDRIIHGRNAFTRIELSIAITSVVVVLLVCATGLADTRSRSQRAGCVDNLRQIGQAVQLWAADHENNNPWTVRQASGGTRPLPGMVKPANAWFEFLNLSNQLVTPKILVCPSDKIRFANSANDWSSTFSGFRFRANAATSYTIGLHSVISDPDSLLSSDRNLRTDSLSGTCSMGVNNVPSVFASSSSITAWTNSIHLSSGNLLLNDGRVLETSNSALKSYFDSLSRGEDGLGTLHLLIP